MQSIDLLRDNLNESRDRVLARVEDMRDYCVVFPTGNGGCHTLWVLGHLAYIEAWVVRGFMLGQENPLAKWWQHYCAFHVYVVSAFRRTGGTRRVRLKPNTTGKSG